MKGQREAKREGGSKLPWIITGAVVGVLAAAYLGTCAWALGRSTILPNVSVAGIDVSNMTVDQAKDVIVDRVEQQGKDISLTLAYEDLEEGLDVHQVMVDADQSSWDAWEIGHGSFFAAGPQLVGHMLGMSSQVPLVLPENEPAQAALMSRMEQAVNEATRDHGYEVTQTELVMTKGAPVTTVDWENVKAELSEELRDAFQERFSGTSEKVEKTITLSASQGRQEEPDFEAIRREVYAEPKDASLDVTTMEVSDHAVGVDFDVEELKTAYRNAKSGETVIVPLTVTRPNVTREDLEGRLFRDLLGEATTRVGGSSARKTNVKLAAAACNEKILLPGEEFSYNNTTGSRSPDKGYLPAPIYAGGRSEDGVGGGICQVSSTIYYAVLHTTLEIVERHDHQFAVSYLDPGMDATVYYGSLDFRFKNNTNYPIKVVTRSYDNSKGVRYLEVQLYGTNEDGRYGKPSNAVFDKVAPSTAYKPDPNVARGTLVLDREQYAYTGMKARTYRTICEADGTVVEKQDLGVSTYKMRPNTYFYNPADGDPSTWVNGKPPAPPTTDPGTTTPEDPGTETPTDPITPPPSDSGISPIDPGEAAM